MCHGCLHVEVSIPMRVAVVAAAADAVAVAVAAAGVVQGGEHPKGSITVSNRSNENKLNSTHSRLTAIPMPLVMSMISASTSKSMVIRRWMASRQRMAVRNQMI